TRGPTRFLQRGKELAKFAQARQRAPGQRRLDPRAVAEQVAKERMRRAGWMLGQQGRAAGLLQPQAQRGRLQVRVDRRGQARELPGTLQVREEAAQVVEAHAPGCSTVARSAARFGRGSMPCCASQRGSNRVSA